MKTTMPIPESVLDAERKVIEARDALTAAEINLVKAQSSCIVEAAKEAGVYYGDLVLYKGEKYIIDTLEFIDLRSYSEHRSVYGISAHLRKPKGKRMAGKTNIFDLTKAAE